MKFLMMAASLSENSLNKKLISNAAHIIEKANHEVNLVQFSEFNMSLYNADIEKKSGLPSGAKSFIEKMHVADAMIFSSPEYNFSMPGTFKNFFDWISRERPMPWQGKYIYLISASPALNGGNRALWVSRVSFEACGSFVFPSMFSLPKAHEAFDAASNFVDKSVHERLQKSLMAFIEYMGKVIIR